MYGPVEVDLTLCDGPECNNCVQDCYMVGWQSLGYIGTETHTMGSMPDNMEFCSLGCLKKALDLMTG